MTNSIFLDLDIRRLTIGDVLARRAHELGEKTYMTCVPTGRSYSYADINRISDRWANALIARGIGKGAHVAVMMENCPEQLLLYFAIGKIGGVCVPINTAARGRLLAYYLQLADVTALFADVALLDRVADISDQVPLLSQIFGARTHPDAKATASLPGLQDLADLDQDPDESPCNLGGFSDPGFIAFTSGTTGPSKAILITQAGMMLGALNYARSYGYAESDTYYICLPLFHASAVRAAAYLMLMAGGSIALARWFSVSRFWSEVRASGATTFNLLGSMVNFLWNAPPSADETEHSVRFCRMAPVPHFARGFEDRFNLRIVSAYGLTDVGIPAAYTLDHPREKLGSCGKPREGWQVKILDEDDFEVPQGEAGEICLRCDVPWHTASGYYKMPEETLKMTRNGWYHTGDRGYLDEDGFLFFADRKKDALRRRGENISAWEVEQILQRHPAVREVAIYAVKAETSEDEVAASVVLNAGVQASESEIVEFCRRNMAYFMVPRFVQFVDALPMTPTQKVEKAKLRARAAEFPDSLWDREKAGITIGR
jgi:crotonobetaine/carnitine-CoA ligase